MSHPLMRTEIRAPKVRPRFNTGTCIDAMTGSWYTGSKGESLLSGGLAHVTHVCGQGNVGKSQFVAAIQGAVQEYYRLPCMWRCNEMSGSINRVNQLYKLAAPELIKEGEALAGDQEDKLGLAELRELFIFTDKTKETCTEWADAIKEYALQTKKKPSLSYWTPFPDYENKRVLLQQPLLVVLDSLSEHMPDRALKIQENESAGAKESNMLWMNGGHAKTQMLQEWATHTAIGGLYIATTIHVGKEHSLDPRQPPIKLLRFLKQSLKLKNAPEKATFLSNDIWYIIRDELLTNDTTKAPQWPRNSLENEQKGSVDLKMLTIGNLRGKAGPSGLPFTVVVSQEQGILWGLTDWLWLKQHGDSGIIDPTRAFQSLELYPDVKLSRTTIRSLIQTDRKLARALQITRELLQYRLYHIDADASFVCDPATLYKDIKALGYDWDMILSETDSRWHPDIYNRKYLSILDLLNIRAGLYTPYWK